MLSTYTDQSYIRTLGDGESTPQATQGRRIALEKWGRLFES